MGLRRAEPEQAVYRVELIADEPASGEPDDVRDRIGLLNAAMATALKGNRLLHMVSVDYLKGCLIFDMETSNLRGVRGGRVQVRVHRLVAS